MTIIRDELETSLIEAKGNNFIKILTGIRRVGKSFALFNIFKNHLLDSGIPPDNIIEVDLEKPANKPLTNPFALDQYVRKRIAAASGMCYVLIDEIQRCHKVLPDGVDLNQVHPDDRESCYISFIDILNGLRTTPNVDVYVTGSNSKMLSSDVATEFRGRGQIINVHPLSFREFCRCKANNSNPYALLEEYMRFGGMPDCVLKDSDAEKRQYLANLYDSIYIRDVIERNKIKDAVLLERIIDIVMSAVGSLTNPNKLANVLATTFKASVNQPTISHYLQHLENAFIIKKVNRYDIKGRHYLDYPAKYYATDTGLRNARMNFRQFEPSHLMENVIYCELIRRGYSVDIGVVERERHSNGRHESRRYEVDFVINDPPRQIYIQSAYLIPDEQKRVQETTSLLGIKNNFPKLVITNDPLQPRTCDESGITYMNLLDFLLDAKSIDIF